MAFSRLRSSRRDRDKRGWARYWHSWKISHQYKQEEQDEKQGIDDKSTSVADSTKVATGGSLAPSSHSGGGGTRDRPEKIDGNAGDREGETAGEEVTEDLDAIFREVRGR
jgi:hypothetical protein